MKLYGACRVRNEEEIIESTLTHVSEFCDKVFVFDDASTDSTRDICANHPSVSEVFTNEEWSPDPKIRNLMEGLGRQVPYDAALEAGADYIYIFDADEHAEFTSFQFVADHHPMRLFAFYITPEDVEGTWKSRKWMGPEYQDINMIWKAIPRKFSQRDITNTSSQAGNLVGYVKHYGKAISVEQWDKDCDYYTQYRWKNTNPRLHARWMERYGKAVHHQSDFGRPLIEWRERNGRHITELKE